MKVLLVNEAEYELKEDTMKKIPFDTFNMLRDASLSDESGEKMLKVRLFKNMADYNRTVREDDLNEFDDSKDVLISNKGNIFVFLKSQNFTENDSADSEENQGQ